MTLNLKLAILCLGFVASSTLAADASERKFIRGEPANLSVTRVRQVIFRLSSLLLLFACAPHFQAAHGTERVGDSAYSYELEQYAASGAGLEKDLLALIEAASSDERFYLYWTYNHLTGSWVQIECLRTQLELALAAPPDADEEVRTRLRDQAQFVHWELGNAIDTLGQNAPEVRRLNHLWINEALRSLLSNVRTTAYRLWSDQCARMPCAVGP